MNTFATVRALRSPAQEWGTGNSARAAAAAGYLQILDQVLKNIGADLNGLKLVKRTG